MSSSPKYSHAQLSREEAERLRLDQERAREQARLDRERQEREEQERRLVQARQTVERLVDRLAQHSQELTAGPLSRWVNSAAIEAVRQEGASRREALAKGDEKLLRTLSSTLSNLVERLQTEEAAAKRAEARWLAIRRQHEVLFDRSTSDSGEQNRFLAAEHVARLHAGLNAIESRLGGARTDADLDQLERELIRLEAEFGPSLLRASRLAEQSVKQGQQLIAARQRWDAFLQDDPARFVDEEQRLVFVSRIGAVERFNADSHDEASLGRAEREIKQLSELLSQRMTAARASLRAEHLAAEEAALARLIEEVNGGDASVATKFDSVGFETLRSCLDTVQRALSQGDLEGGRGHIQTAQRHWERHRGVVARNREVWEQARAAAAAALVPAVDRLTRIAESPRVQRWFGNDLAALQLRGRDLQSLFDAENFGKVSADAPGLAVDSERLLDAARELEEGAAELERLSVSLVELEKRTGNRFNVVGRGNVEAYLDGAREALRKGVAAKLTEHCRSANEQWTKHQAAVEREFAVWQQERDAAADAVGAARVQLTGLEGDGAVVRWMSPRLGKFREMIEEAEQAVAAGRFSEAMGLSAGLEAAAKEVIAEIGPLEMRAATQRKIRDGMKAAMRSLGFVITAGDHENDEENCEQRGNPESALILHAEKPEPGTVPGQVAVAVEPTGAVKYEVGGAYKKKTTWSEDLRKEVRSCDEAEDQIGRLHKLLKSLGIEMDGLWWDDKPPERPDAAQNDSGQDRPAGWNYPKPPRSLRG